MSAIIVRVAGTPYPTLIDAQGVQRFVEVDGLDALVDPSCAGPPGSVTVSPSVQALMTTNGAVRWAVRYSPTNMTAMRVAFRDRAFSERDLVEFYMHIGYSVSGLCEVFPDLEVLNPLWEREAPGDEVPPDLEADLRAFHVAAEQPLGVPLGSFTARDSEGLLGVMGDPGFAARVAPEGDPRNLRARLMLEELGETLIALRDGNRVELADGLADLVYVTVGTAITFGIPFNEVWREVHRSNMAKFPPCPRCGGNGRLELWECETCAGRGTQLIRRVDGKVLKPETWTPPDIAGVLARKA